MEYQVILGPLAQEDLFAIHCFIARDSLHKANQFCGLLLKQADSLSSFPERGRKEKSGKTRLIVYRSYLIYYDIDHQLKQVVILRFWHGARDPSNLRLT